MQISAHAFVPTEVPCVGCRSLLPPGAVFCVECGLCVLDVTRGGTVIARSPLRTIVGEIGAPPSRLAEPTLADLRAELDVPAMSGEYVVLDDDDIELLDETEELDMDLFLDDADRTLVTRGLVAPAPYWAAPPRGETCVGPAPRR